MFLRYTKEISPEIAEQLRTAAGTLSFLGKINDVEYLCAAAKTVGEVGNFFQKLTRLVQPEYEMSQKYKRQIYRKTSGSQKKYAYVNCGNGGYGNLITFALTGATKLQFGFYLGPFATGKNEFGRWAPTSGYILKVAQYFFNRFATYKEIYKLLEDQQKAFKQAVGPSFAEAIKTLFSVDKLLIPAPIVLSLKNLEPQILNRKVKKVGSIFLGTAVYHPTEYFCGSFYLTEVKNELWLTKANQLLLEVFPKYQTQAKALKRMEEVKEDKEFKLFLEQQIGKWLEALLVEADFGKKLYEKNKTNILIGTI